MIRKLCLAVGIGALALLVAGCGSDLTTTQIAMLTEAAKLESAKAVDIDPNDGYTSETECAILNRPWFDSGGGGGSGVPSGFSFPYCGTYGNSHVPGGAPLGPTVIGRSGTLY